MKIFLSINVNMPTMDDILTFMNRKNNILGLSEPEKMLIVSYVYTYEHFHMFILMSIKNSMLS